VVVEWQSGRVTGSSRTTSLFDRWSRTYDRLELQSSTYRPVHDAVLRRLDGSEPEVVVDLGCGTGQLTRRLAERFPETAVVGVELSEGMLARAGAAGHDGAMPCFVRGDALALPVRAGSVDAVVCTESFHWYPDQRQVLDDLARVLRPDGRLVIASIATVTQVGNRMLRRASGLGGAEIRAIPPRSLRSMLVLAGFEVLHQRRIPRLGIAAWPVLTDARRP
jgi:ubiquinone/menaquinone biosynthesis C-methylase UbiE